MARSWALGVAALACLLTSVGADHVSSRTAIWKKMDAVDAHGLPTFFPVTGFGGSGTRAVR